MKPVAALFVLLFATLHLAGCKDAPGADGEAFEHATIETRALMK